MKRFYKFLMPLVAIVAMALPWNVSAQLTTIVADGTTTNNYIPIYGLWADDYTRSQFIYPATMLEDLTSGSQITSLTFYSSTASQNWGAATFDVKLGEVTETTLSSYLTYDATTVYSGAVTISGNQMVITFDSPYTYMGGNLMVEFFQTVTGTYHGESFYGVSATGASASGYSSSSASSASFNQRGFLAKMQIEYTPSGDDICYNVRNVVVSDIDSASFTLTWRDTLNSGASYIIYDMSDTSVVATVYDTTYTITGLDGNTLYHYAIVTDCGTGSFSGYVRVNVRTACGTTAIPYNEGFESLTTGTAPNCWNSMSGDVTVKNSSSNAHSGSQYLDFRGSYSNAIALPPMGMPTNQLQVRFWTRPESFTSSSCGTFSVGYMTDLNVDTTFVELDNWAYSAFSAYEEKEVPMIGAPDNAYIVLRHNANATNYYWYVDDLVVEPIPACVHPLSVSASNIVSDGADITVLGTDNSTFRLIWSDGTTTDSIDITTATYSITGLTANTLYSLSAMTVCDDDSLTSAVSTNFRTACSGYTSVPYTEGFEGYYSGDVPNCWQQLATGTSGALIPFPAAYSYASNARTGDVYFEFESSTGETEIVALPEMENISTLSLTMWVSSSASYPCTLEVGVMEGTVFVPVDTLNLITFSGTSNWKQNYNEYTTYFSNYSGTGERIALRASNTGSGQITLFVDDLSVNVFEGCYPVTDLTLLNVDSNALTVGWTDELNSGASYVVSYWVGNDTLVEYVSDDSITLINLGGNTLYNVSVVANCGSGESTPVVGSFRTACGTTAIPFTEGFEGLTTGVAPSCWTPLSGNVYVRNSSSNSHSGNNYLDFRGSQPNAIALPPMGMPTNQLQVRFWTRPESFSYSSCGSFAVGYMTDLTDNTSFVELASWAYNEFSAYEEKEVPMIGAPDTAYIVLRHNSNSTVYYWYVDDLVVEPIPSCMHPVSVSASNIVSDSADITISGSDNASYRLFWSDGTTTDSVDIANDSTYTLTNLVASTTYTVSAATICDDGSLTSTVSTTFKTDCIGGGCDVVINMTDSYGDGWNGAAIVGVSAGQTLFTATLSDGGQGTFTYHICSSDTLQLTWTSGMYDDEAGFDITVGGDPVVSGSGSTYSGGTIATINGCPACIAPSNIVIDSVGINDATIHWSGSASGYRVYWSDGTVSDSTDVFDNNYVITGLAASTLYTLGVATICDGDELSMPVTSSFRTQCANGGCDVVISMTDDYGDGWNGAAINGIINGVNTFSATIEGVASGSFTYGICSSDTLQLTWTSGEFDDEAGFTVTVGGAEIASGMGDDYQDGAIIGSVVGCPTCPSPTDVTVDSVAAYEITLHWTAGEEAAWAIAINDSLINNVSTNPYTITGLEQYTMYTISVYAVCTGDDTSYASTPISVQTLVACPWPTNFAATTSGDTASFTWDNDANASWEITYGPTGFNPDTATIFPVSTNSYQETGFATGFYQAYLRTNCGTDNSIWVGPLDFFIGIDIMNMATSGIDTLQTCNALIYDDGGPNGNYSSSCQSTLILLPDNPGSDIVVSGSSTTEGSYDYLTIYDGVGTSGTILFQDNTSSDNSTHTFGPFSSAAITVVFHSDASVTYAGFEIQASCSAPASCLRPADVTVSNITGTSANITWTPTGGESEWEVSLNGVSTIVSSPSYNAMGLANNTTYSVVVRAICAPGDTSSTTGAISFITTMCDNGEMHPNYDATAAEVSSGSSYSPIGYSLYDYSYVQTIIDSATMAQFNGAIEGFGFMPTTYTTGSANFSGMHVYMANVPESDLSAGFILPDANHTFVHVINNADFSFTNDDLNGWLYFGFDTTFTWDGHSNVVFAVNRLDGNWASSPQFAAHTATGDKMRYCYQDGSAYDINTVNTVSSYTSSTVGDIMLYNCGGAVHCNAPAVGNAITGETTATLSWSGSAASYEVAVVAGNWVEPASGTPVTGLTYTATGLIPGTQYAIGVRAVCDEALYSDWVVTNVTTIDHPCNTPSNVNATAITVNGATISWTAGDADQTNFQIRYSAAADTTIVDVTANPYTLTGLLTNTEYSVTVRAVCGQGNYSDWADAYTFTTTICQPVSNVTVTEMSQTTATITWNAGSNSNGTYEVAYGITGTSVQNATRQTVTGTTYTIIGLEEGTGYVVYVRSMCAEGVYSEYTSGTNFTTENEIGIADVDNANISLYPNPASSTVTLTGIEGAATVTVVDMNGRENGKWKVESGKLTIDVSSFAQGAYFVRITGEQVNAIRKLIVR